MAGSSELDIHSTWQSRFAGSQKEDAESTQEKVYANDSLLVKSSLIWQDVLLQKQRRELGSQDPPRLDRPGTHEFGRLPLSNTYNERTERV